MNMNFKKYEVTPKLKIWTLLRSVCLTITCVTVSAVSYAQTSDRTFSKEAGQIVNSAMVLAQNNEFRNALDILEAEVLNDELVPYERATIYQMIGQYNYELERPMHAQRAFENALDTGGLIDAESENLKVVIAQLMIGNGQYREGAERLEAYLNSGGAQNSQYTDLLVNAWVKDDNYSRALPWAEKWFNAARPKERRHYELLSFLYKNLGVSEKQAELTKEMKNRWPEGDDL